MRVVDSEFKEFYKRYNKGVRTTVKHGKVISWWLHG